MTVASVPTAYLVAAGLDRNTAAVAAVPYSDTADLSERVRRCERLHRLYTGRARWWGVLQRTAVDDPAIPLVYVRAVAQARRAAEHQADEWSAQAGRWSSHIADAESDGVGDRR